jgi:hypothetical protein
MRRLKGTVVTGSPTVTGRATLPSPDREIVLLRVVAGVSIPDIVAIWVSHRPRYAVPKARH